MSGSRRSGKKGTERSEADPDDFGRTLDRWERRATGGEAAGRGDEMERWLSLYPPGDRAAREPAGGESPAEARASLRAMKPQRTLDLHGSKADQVSALLEGFLEKARRDGLRKVLIIHGKGHHSRGAAVLGPLVRRLLERSPLAGEAGVPGRELGGSGATWVILL